MLFLRLRFQQLRNEIVRGWYEVPYLYFSLSFAVISVFGIIYKINEIPSKDHFYMRHKRNYIILRPDDVRLDRYPREFITDIDVLDKYRKSQENQNQK